MSTYINLLYIKLVLFPLYAYVHDYTFHKIETGKNWLYLFSLHDIFYMMYGTKTDTLHTLASRCIYHHILPVSMPKLKNKSLCIFYNYITSTYSKIKNKTILDSHIQNKNTFSFPFFTLSNSRIWQRDITYYWAHYLLNRLNCKWRRNRNDYII